MSFVVVLVMTVSNTHRGWVLLQTESSLNHYVPSAAIAADGEVKEK